jgi:hypothetical protein
MTISEFPTPIKDSLSQFGDFTLISRSPIKLRGSNFQDSSFLYCDSQSNKKWLWKRSNNLQVIREYLASYLAARLGINVPTTFLAQKGTQIGLLYEWLDESVELRESSDILLNKCPPKDIIQLLLLEAWIGASDRHSGNYLISKDNIWAIDLERSFDTEPLDSELSLYFEWLNESQVKVKEKIEEFKKLIQELKILQEDSSIKNMIEFLPVDERAKLALKNQVEKMFNNLRENFMQLSVRIDHYFQKSQIQPLF